MTSQRPESRTAGTTTLAERIETIQLRLEQVERALSAVARESVGVSVAGPCSRCRRSLLLVKEGTLECPTCGYRRSL